MKTYQLEGTSRAALGKNATKKVRAEGLVPCVLYSKEGPVHLAISARALRDAVYTKDTYLLELSVDGKAYKAVISDSQYHPIHDTLLHLDLLEVQDDKAVTLYLPVRLSGNSVGVLAGGRLVQKQRRLKVRGIYKNMPEELVVDITDLKLGKSIIVSELQFDGLQIAMPGDVPVASVEITRQLRQEAAATGKAPKK